MADCAHLQFEAAVDVARLSAVEGGPINGYAADVRVRCRDCGLPFQFLGLSPGASPTQPMVSIDGLEARMPLAPAGNLPNPLHRMQGARERFDA